MTKFSARTVAGRLRIAEDDVLMTSTEVAEMLHLHVNTVKRVADRGELPFFRVCKRGDRRYRLGDVKRYLRDNTNAVLSQQLERTRG